MTDKEIQLKLEEIVFEEIIAPNCATCSDAISGHPNKCDNGINCMSKLLNGEFINYKKIKDLDQNKALKAENKRKTKALEEIIAPGFFITGRIEKIAKAALQPEQEKSCKSCLRFKSDNPMESCTSQNEDYCCGGWTVK